MTMTNAESGVGPTSERAATRVRRSYMPLAEALETPGARLVAAIFLRAVADLTKAEWAQEAWRWLRGPDGFACAEFLWPSLEYECWFSCISELRERQAKASLARRAWPARNGPKTEL